MEPDAVPSPERARSVLMVAGQLCGKIGGLELGFRIGDAVYAGILDEDVRGEQDETAYSVVGSGVDQRDRATIPMADQDRGLRCRTAPANRAKNGGLRRACI